MKRILLGLAGAVLFAGTAMAVPYVSLDIPTLSTLTVLGSTGAAPAFNGSSTAPTHVRYTTVWADGVDTVVTADVGKGSLGLDWSVYSHFFLNVENTNENTWEFAVSVSDGTTTVTDGFYSIAKDASKAFLVDLSGLTKTTIDKVYVTVRGDIPLPTGSYPSTDRTAEYVLSPVPEPATMMLLGTGLLGLAGVSRRRKK